MNTLRAKIALLLIVAIVSVVGLLTLVMRSFLGPPSPQRTIEPVAEQIELLTRIGKTDTSPSPSPSSRPAAAFTALPPSSCAPSSPSAASISPLL